MKGSSTLADKHAETPYQLRCYCSVPKLLLLVKLHADCTAAALHAIDRQRNLYSPHGSRLCVHPPVYIMVDTLIAVKRLICRAINTQAQYIGEGGCWSFSICRQQLLPSCASVE
jgi:hypothetical protein